VQVHQAPEDTARRGAKSQSHSVTKKNRARAQQSGYRNRHRNPTLIKNILQRPKEQKNNKCQLHQKFFIPAKAEIQVVAKDI
jgi:hypothetical protein